LRVTVKVTFVALMVAQSRISTTDRRSVVGSTISGRAMYAA